MKIRLVLLVGLMFVLPAWFSACAVPLADEYWIASEYGHAPIKTLAILPPANQTVDVESPEIVRNLVGEKLPDRGYTSPGHETIDRVLRDEFGITDGGQLSSVSSDEICQALGADALLYTTVETWNTVITAVYNKAVVKLHFKIYGCRQKREVFSARDEEKRRTADIYPHKMVANTLRIAQESYVLLAEQVVMNSMDSLPEAGKRNDNAETVARSKGYGGL